MITLENDTRSQASVDTVGDRKCSTEFRISNKADIACFVPYIFQTKHGEVLLHPTSTSICDFVREEICLPASDAGDVVQW